MMAIKDELPLPFTESIKHYFYKYSYNADIINARVEMFVNAKTNITNILKRRKGILYGSVKLNSLLLDLFIYLEPVPSHCWAKAQQWVPIFCLIHMILSFLGYC